MLEEVLYRIWLNFIISRIYNAEIGVTNSGKHKFYHLQKWTLNYYTFHSFFPIVSYTIPCFSLYPCSLNEILQKIFFILFQLQLTRIKISEWRRLYCNNKKEKGCLASCGKHVFREMYFSYTYCVVTRMTYACFESCNESYGLFYV